MTETDKWHPSSAGEEAASAWFATPQALGSFNASFTYQDSNPSPYGAADGITFAIQNSGTDYLGGTGNYLGYGEIPGVSSAAIVLDVFGGSYTQLETGSTTARIFGGAQYMTTGAVNLASGDPVLVTLTYDAIRGELNEELQEVGPNGVDVFLTSYTGVNLASILDSPTAYIGFTGGTGGLYSQQTVSDFNFAPVATVPEPPTLLLFLGGLALLGLMWRRSARATAGL